MGTIDETASPLGEALFSSVQRRVLSLLLGHPERAFQSAEVIRLAQSGTGAVHRELRRLEAAGWLTATRVGNQKHYQANRECPGFHELHGLVIRTLDTEFPGGRAAEPVPDESPSLTMPAPPPRDGWKVW
jgi:hypothetical protein